MLDGRQLNAADFQIAPSIALLLGFADLAPIVERHPAVALARRLLPDGLGRIAPVLPAEWLRVDTAVAAASGRG